MTISASPCVRFSRLASAAFALCLLWSNAAQATADWLISGFGTVAVTRVGDRDVSFSHPANLRTGRPRLDFGADSVLGLQASGKLGERTGLTLQVLSSDTHAHRFRPRVAWAFLSHESKPGLTLRAGRMRAPFFMLSDSNDIRYAHPWVRPPVEVYGLNPFNEVTGVDLLWRTQVGHADIELQPFIGTGGSHRFPDGNASLSSHRGLSIGIDTGRLSLHFSHARGQLNLRYRDPLFGFVVGNLPAGQEHIAKRLSGKGAQAQFSSLGFSWDDGQWSFMGEVAIRSANRFLGRSTGWHLTAARRIGEWTPFIALSEQRRNRSVVRADPSVPGLEAYLLSRNAAQRSLALGLRWDLQPGLAAKGQWSRSKVDRRGWGSFAPDPDATRSPAGRRFDTLSLSLDFVF